MLNSTEKSVLQIGNLALKLWMQIIAAKKLKSIGKMNMPKSDLVESLYYYFIIKVERIIYKKSYKSFKFMILIL